GLMPFGSVAGIASQHSGPFVHVGLEPAGALHQPPRWSSNVWFSWTRTTRCLTFEVGQGPAHDSSCATAAPGEVDDELHAASGIARAGTARARHDQARMGGRHATSARLNDVLQAASDRRA